MSIDTYYYVPTGARKAKATHKFIKYKSAREIPADHFTPHQVRITGALDIQLFFEDLLEAVDYYVDHAAFEERISLFLNNELAGTATNYGELRTLLHDISDDYNDDLPTVPSPAEYICPKHPHQTWAAGKCLLCEVVDSTADPNLTPGVAEQDLIDEEPITINNNPEEL